MNTPIIPTPQILAITIMHMLTKQCWMAELNDGRKIWHCDGYGYIESPDGSIEGWDFDAQDGVDPRDIERNELYAAVTNTQPMSVKLLARMRELFSQQPIMPTMMVLTDFHEWSGGFLPSEVEPKQIESYIETRLTMELKGNERKSMIEDLRRMNAHF